MAQLTIRLPEELSQRLDTLAETTHRSKSFYVIEALQSALDDLEDIYLADSRMEDLRAGRSRTYTMEEVGQELGLED